MEDGAKRAIAIGENGTADYMTEPLYDLERLPTSVPELRAADVWWSTEIPAVTP